MLATENASTLDLPPRPSAVVDVISDALSNASIQPDSSSNNKDSPVSPTLQNVQTSRPFITYTRSQLLHLHKSPLVKVPDGMPAFKDWFGTEGDQGNVKKDPESSALLSNARDRRFRRDADDGTPSRPSFRGTAITQPSQMGNFKHQSIRTADRDRERDVDREQDRDSKSKEGQGSLRNLSDKYDRDRRAMNQLRNKDRELPPHLANTASRVTSQSQTTGSRAADSREPSKKKDVDSPEDWRRGTESSRGGRSDNGRKARDDRDRERPRSRARDSSRARADGSLSIRDRDADRDREDRLGEGGNSHRRDRDDREHERESEADDPRRWRDDGRRDERIAARRDREARERVRERATWDNADRSDRRWMAEECDTRNKKANGKDKKASDDARDREERKDREREKEPAWMDTYIPGSSGSGFGMPRAGGELDGIQAFKKELREKQQRNQVLSVAKPVSDPQAKADLPTLVTEAHLDEIQLFKLMMKREEEKRKAESPSATLQSTQSASENTSVGDKLAGLQDQEAKSENGTAISSISALSKQNPLLPSTQLTEDSSKRTTQDAACPPSMTITNPNGPESEHNLNSVNSQLLQAPVGSGLSPVHETSKSSMDVPTVTSAPPNVAVGSRLLALGSRPPHGSTGPPRSTASQSPISPSQKSTTAPTYTSAGTGGSLNHPPSDTNGQSATPAELLQGHNGFYPFDDHRDGTTQLPVSGSSARSPFTFTGERNALGYAGAEQALVAEHSAGPLPGQPFDGVNSGIAAAKGSRFAKFFDGKGRDSNPTTVASKGMMGNLATLPPQKTGALGHHNADARAMEDIFAMLNNSARQNTVPEISNLDHLDPHRPPLQVPQPPQQLVGHGRVEPMYDSRLDDRTFVPDGMVPGLRSVPPRTRQNGEIFAGITEDPMHFNAPRGSGAQMYHGGMSSSYMHHAGRGGGHLLQGYRGGPSANTLPSAQRLPPGLANLGGRPPHDPTQYISQSIGLANGGIHAPPHGNVPTQQPFNNYQQAAGLGFGGGPQMRMPHHNPLQGLMHTGNMSTTQAQLLSLAGTTGLPGGLRGPNNGFGPQGQPPHMMMRQAQHPQQQIPPHILPLHLQQQGMGSANNQVAHDLMALLMNGTRRAE